MNEIILIRIELLINNTADTGILKLLNNNNNIIKINNDGNNHNIGDNILTQCIICIFQFIYVISQKSIIVVE